MELAYYILYGHKMNISKLHYRSARCKALWNLRGHHCRPWQLTPLPHLSLLTIQATLTAIRARPIAVGLPWAHWTLPAETTRYPLDECLRSPFPLFGRPCPLVDQSRRHESYGQWSMKLSNYLVKLPYFGRRGLFDGYCGDSVEAKIIGSCYCR